MNRRTLLRTAGLGLAVGLAGCAADGGAGDGGTPTGGPTETATPTPTPSPTPDGGTALVGSETVQYSATSALPGWYDGRDGPPGQVVVIDAAERAEAALSPGDLPPDRRGAVEELLEAVDYDRDLLLYVQSGGPDTCYSQVEVADLALVEEGLTGTARAVDTSEPGEGCGDALTFPAALVRATFDGAPPTTVALEIADGFGQTATVTGSADDPLPDGGSGPGDSSGPGDDERIDPLTCDDPDFQRLPGGDAYGDFAYGSVAVDGAETVTLEADRDAYERGDTLAVTLTNVADGEMVTGNRHKYALQVLTTAGWQDVRGTTEGPVGYTDEGVVHEPGEGFEWAITLTSEGVVADHPLVNRLTVCPGLPAGQYRFLYWGITEGEADAVAAGFEITG